MNSFYVFLLSFTIISNTVAFEWESVAGCYSTIQYNSRPISDTAENYSVINLNENPLYFISAENNELNVHSLIIFKAPRQGHFYQDVFFEDGQNINKEGKLYNSFTSEVRSRFDEQKIYSIDSKTSVSALSNERIQVIVKLSIKGFLGDYKESGHFILKRKRCLSDEDSEEHYLKGLKIPYELSL
ncbi:hypothetical protein [Halobacteriovorax sp. HLS]|uniref:hypothetical protein n=1 Tax=Halobacteriovorax sp. HLS TaxID=2234000 RepID=UPI000FD906E7|nr:hypothetical protein [Halobacteriovorax sp. HLS]